MPKGPPVMDAMPGPLFEAITRLDSLEAAWGRVRSNAGAAGVDGVSVTQFAEAAAVRLLTLHRQVRQGTYQPRPLRRISFPKPDGGERVLSIPAVVDRIVQTAVTDALVPLLEPEFEEDSFAYRPGRSVQQAVERVRSLREQGYGWVVDGDIERYFDSVPHPPLLSLLDRFIPDPAVIDLITLWLDQMEGGVGLPQGSPLSPLLSNLYLDRLDEEAADAAFGRGVRLVRYADDFVLLCRTEDSARAALRRVGTMLTTLGLALNPDKTRVVSFEAGFRFLGHLFVRSLVLKSPPAQQGAGLAEDRSRALLADLARQDAMADRQEQQAEAEQAAGLSAVTRVLYIMEPGRRLALRNASLSVMEGEAELLALSPGRVGRVEIGPGGGVEDAALRSCLLDGIPVHLVDGWGQEVGACLPPLTDRTGLHLAQARLVLDPQARTDAARAIAAAKIHNQRALLRRLNRSLNNADVATAAAKIGRLIRKLPLQPDVAAVMGVEGQAAALYWPAYGRLLRAPWSLAHRRRRPAPDPVNAVLSWLSSLLTREVAVLVTRHGLHPGFAVLHGSRDDHQGCVYDLMEALRGPLVEALTVTLFNQRHLGEADFDLSQPDRCRLLPDGRRTVIRQWEAWLDRPIRSLRRGVQMRWRGLMEEEILAFARHVRDGEEFLPYRMDY